MHVQAWVGSWGFEMQMLRKVRTMRLPSFPIYLTTVDGRPTNEQKARSTSRKWYVLSHLVLLTRPNTSISRPY